MASWTWITKYPDPDPLVRDPDPYQNVTDQQDLSLGISTVGLFMESSSPEVPPAIRIT